MADLREELKAEYALLQTHYEAYDARALLIKSWSAPLLAAGVGVGASLDGCAPLVIATLVAALCLWTLEGFSKIYQRAFDDRIESLEAWFAGPGNMPVAPFQMLSGWRKSFDESKREGLARDLARFMLKPAVCIPYLPIVIVGCAALALDRLN